MTKSQLIDELSIKAKIPKESAIIVVKTILEKMIQAMIREERIEIRNFGNFTIRHYDSYEGRNPKTGERVNVGKKKMPFFKAGLGIKKLVNGEI